MNATMTSQVRIPTLANPFAVALRWLMSAQIQAEHDYQLAEMPVGRLQDMGIDVNLISREAPRPMIHC
jgi:hypothetical protein